MPDKQKPWTVLVYMVAEDLGDERFLDPIASDEIARIFAIAESNPDSMHVATQVDFTRLRGVRRQIGGRAPEQLRESIASDPRVLKKFFDWGVSECPAERYLVLFWGHSFGTAGLFPDGRPGKTTLEETLNLSDLGFVLHDAAGSIAMNGANDKVDIVLFKNCCMSALETAYELQGSVRYMIGSQGRVPAQGWPYDGILASLDERPSDSIATSILYELASFYENPENRGEHSEIPYSVVDVDAAGDVEGPLSTVVRHLIAARRSSAASVTRAGLLCGCHALPGDAALLDLRAVCREFQALGGAVGAAARDLDDVVRRLVLEYQPDTHTLFHGLSIFYFPGNPEVRAESIVAPVTFAGDYQRLKLSRDTEWDRIACERMPDFEALSLTRFPERSSLMAEEKPPDFGAISNAADRVMQDIRSLQQFVGRLTAAADLSADGEAALNSFKSRAGTGLRSIVADINSVVSHLRANMDVLESKITRAEPVEERSSRDRRTAPASSVAAVPAHPEPRHIAPRASTAPGHAVRLADLYVTVGPYAERALERA